MIETQDNGNANWRLRPKARIIRIMGDELVSSEIVAIIELVKNAYDADATRVVINFDGPIDYSGQFIKEDSKLEIIDNGSGISLAVVKNIWMEPATTYKRKEKFSPSGRRFLGAKGIGRFASSRLADELVLITREASSELETQVFFDWTQFNDDEKYLDQVEILWAHEDPKEIRPNGSIEILWKDRSPTNSDLTHGTILRMSILRDEWNQERVQELRRGLARLVSPFFKSQNFQIYLNLPRSFDHLSGVVDPPPIFEHPHYSIRGSVDVYGRYSMNLWVLGEEHHLQGRFKAITGLSENNQIEDSDPSFESEARETEAGPFEIELRVWDRDRESLEKTAALYGSTLRNVRRDLDQVAGISVYRDGFRVLPFGEPRNDWLRLDLRRTQNTWRLYNSQVVGYVLISADKNPKLVDQSNREGLVANFARLQFEELVTNVVALVEPYRQKARMKENLSKRRQGGLFDGFDLDSISSFTEDKYPQDAALRMLIREKTVDLTRRVNAAQEVIARYRRLATLGQLIDAVLHEGRAPLSNIGDNTDSGLRLIGRAKPNECEDVLPKLARRFEAIMNQAEVLATVFRRIEPFGGRKRGRPVEVIFEDIVKDSFGVFEKELTRAGIEVSLPNTHHKVTVDASEIQQIFVNLINNSIYWLQHVPKAEREILVEIQRSGDEALEIVFSDNGEGIDEEDKDFIFEPYFSRRPDGVGLGLTLVGEIISDYYNGTLELMENGPLRGANFRILLQKRV